METLITNASSSFSTAVGFGISDAVSYAVGLLKLFAGSMLAILDATKGIIVAVLIIGLVIAVAFYGFRIRHKV